MIKEIQIPSRDIAIQVSDNMFTPQVKKPTLSIRRGNEMTRVANFINWDSAMEFFDFCCDLFDVHEKGD